MSLEPSGLRLVTNALWLPARRFWRALAVTGKFADDV